MRIRTVLSFTTGAAVGAAATYLLDPDHGPARRREVAARAAERARAELRQAPARVAGAVAAGGSHVLAGYREARTP